MPECPAESGGVDRVETPRDDGDEALNEQRKCHHGGFVYFEHPMASEVAIDIEPSVRCGSNHDQLPNQVLGNIDGWGAKDKDSSRECGNGGAPGEDQPNDGEVPCREVSVEFQGCILDFGCGVSRDGESVILFLGEIVPWPIFFRDRPRDSRRGYGAGVMMSVAGPWPAGGQLARISP